ncbi:MAG: serine/threonine-protein kinase, partial [Myxococcales bacterium]|nr:serine/threonine-protein kinase [Myxococcales bacterium]
MGDFAMLTANTLVAHHYRILKTLGKGGMGAVYEAEDTQTSSTVALKTLRTDLYEREDLVKRFEREARAAARIGHPNIIEVYAVGHDDALRTRFIVQEVLRGTDVAGCLNELGNLSPLTAIAIALPVMDALVAAHAEGIVHRDIKPDNLHLDAQGALRVLDLGVAASDGEAFGEINNPGTPTYMAPELFTGATASESSDLFALGVTLYELLTRRYPYGEVEPFQRPRFGDPLPPTRFRPETPEWLEAALLKAVARTPDARFETAEEFLLA